MARLVLTSPINESACRKPPMPPRFHGLAALLCVGLVSGLALCAPARSQTEYYRHTFFDNGPNTSSYYYSSGKAVAPSTLELSSEKLPLDSATFFTPPNSL